MSTGSTPIISIHNTYGAAFIGIIVGAILYGLTTLQTYFYYVHYQKDRSSLKMLVALIWTLDTVHIILAAMFIYYYLVANYNNPPALLIAHWTLPISMLLNILMAFIVHVYFTIKIHDLHPPRRRWITTSIISLTVIGHICFGIETVVFLFIKKELARLPEASLIAATPFAILAVLSDIFVAAALCILLHGSRTNFGSTNAILTTLMIYAINRCILTSVVAVAEVIAFSVSKDTLWYLGIDFVIGKLYANSLLATLNSRQYIRNTGRTIITSVNVSDIEFQSASGSSRTRSDGGPEHSEFIDWARSTKPHAKDNTSSTSGVSHSDVKRTRLGNENDDQDVIRTVKL